MKPTMTVLALLALAACGNKDASDDGEDTTPIPSFDTGDALAADENDTLEDATPYDPDTVDARLTSIEAVSGRLAPAGDRDFYSFAVEAGTPMHLYTRAYADGSPADTVLRVYDEEGTLIGTNDDMLYRLQETDSGIFWIPDYSGTAYVEVLEWADWYNEVEGASESLNGSSSYTYTLSIIVPAPSEYDEGNDSLKAAGALDPDKNEDHVQVFGALHADFDTEVWGKLDKAGDVDFYAFDFTPGEDEVDPDPYFFLTFTAWPVIDANPTGLTYELYNAAGDLMASTDEGAENEDAYFFLQDVGLMIYAASGETYYLAVRGQDPKAEGDQTFYPISSVTYLPTLADYEVEGGVGNNTIETAATINLEQSDDDAARYTAAIWGGQPDAKDVDNYEILAKNLTDGFEGRYFTVRVLAGDMGSLLDPHLEVVDASGKVLMDIPGDAERKDATDPWLRDYQVPKGHDAIYLRVTADGRGKLDVSNNYMMQIITSQTPIYDE